MMQIATGFPKMLEIIQINPYNSESARTQEL